MRSENASECHKAEGRAVTSIRKAFFELMRDIGFDRMTVVDICRRAAIHRSTFYLHYEDKFNLLDALIVEAIETSVPLGDVPPERLCQHAPVDDDYRLLYSDNVTFAHVAAKVIELSAPEWVPKIMEETGLSEDDAYLQFVHSATGNLAVNRILGWSGDERFDHVQKLLSMRGKGGIDAVRAFVDSGEYAAHKASCG